MRGPPSLDQFPQGHRFHPVTFRLDDPWVDAYLQAVEDEATPTLGQGLVPPLAAVALAVRALLDRAALPPGAIHLGQEVHCHRPLHRGEELTAEVAIGGRSQRQGWHLIQVDLVIRDQQGKEAVYGRATVLTPQGEGA